MAKKRNTPKEPRIPMWVMVDALHRTGGLITLAAKQLGCSPDTIRRYMRRYPKVRQAVFEGQEELLDYAEAGLKADVLARKPYAIKLALTTLGRRRGYGLREEAEGMSRLQAEHTVRVIVSSSNYIEGLRQARQLVQEQHHARRLAAAGDHGSTTDG